MELLIQKMSDDAIVPTRGTEDAAGLDLYANHFSINGISYEDEIFIKPGGCVKIGTGIAMEIPKGCYGAVYARSGLASKKGLRPSTCVSVIDSDYRGEIFVFIYNDSDKIQKIVKGDRIAQIVIQRYEDVNIRVVDSLSNTARGEGGFGSTGR